MKNLLGILFLLSITSCFGFNKLNVKLTVVDENQEPVPEANTRIIFHGLSTPDLVKGTSDENGAVVAQGETYIQVEVSAEKEGYYKSQLKVDARREGEDGQFAVVDQDIKLILRKKVNPIALYARKVSLKFPETEVAIGFDLQIGAFVSPYGEGRNNDLYLTMKKEVKSNKHFYQSVIVSFPHEMDGVFGASIKSEYESSELKIDRKAFIGEYQKSLTLDRNKIPGKGYEMSSSLDGNYFVRIRTVVNEDGEVIEANYARFKCESLYGALSEASGIRFTYYFNPEINDTNLEFDPTKNLFTNLKSDEKVYNP
tara:strand:+ start:1967 stop:2902 length:936 start_codon:yes stop_codon:yes gene_type:complete